MITAKVLDANGRASVRSSEQIELVSCYAEFHDYRRSSGNLMIDDSRETPAWWSMIVVNLRVATNQLYLFATVCHLSSSHLDNGLGFVYSGPGSFFFHPILFCLFVILPFYRTSGERWLLGFKRHATSWQCLTPSSAERDCRTQGHQHTSLRTVRSYHWMTCHAISCKD